MNRDYINIPKDKKLSLNIELINELDDDFWINKVHSYLLSFYKNYDKDDLKAKIQQEKEKKHSKIEDLITKYIRKYLKQNKQFSQDFDINGETITDNEKESYYDIKISNTYWKNKNYYCFECKNLKQTPNTLINEYIFIENSSKIDGGVYRYFNGKYAQNQNFGGMLGFILEGNIENIKSKIHEKLINTKEIKLKENGIIDNIIENNNFTFQSLHCRNNEKFKLFHILFDFSI